MRQENQDLATRYKSLERLLQDRTVCFLRLCGASDGLQSDNSLARKVAELEARVRRRDERIRELMNLKNDFVDRMSEKDREIHNLSVHVVEEVCTTNRGCQSLIGCRRRPSLAMQR